MSTKERLAVASLLTRACELGLAIDAVLGDTSLQRLSKPAWVRDCLELGGFADAAALEAARARLDDTPYLRFEVDQAAMFWLRDRQDCVAIWHGFEDGRDARAPAYAERIMLPLSVAEASAIAAYVAAARAPDDFFGKLASRDQPAEMLAPLRAELEELDRQLHVDIRDVLWQDGKGTVTSGGVTLVLDQGNAGVLASALADAAARYAARGLALAA